MKPPWTLPAVLFFLLFERLLEFFEDFDFMLFFDVRNLSSIFLLFYFNNIIAL